MTAIRMKATILSVLAASNLLAQPAGGPPPLKVTTLRDHVGAAEKVQLDVYFIGFPAELQQDLRSGVSSTLSGLNIVDAQPWWIPNVPKYGAAGFATTAASKSLAPTEVPPDGLLRYLPSGAANIGGNWIPLHEIGDLVADWHQNADIVNYIEHAGSYRGVPWKIQNLNFHFLPQQVLASLVPLLEGSQRTLPSTNPQTHVTLYSYNVLMDWLARFTGQPAGSGRNTLVFLNLPGIAAGQPYSFYAEPAKDVVPTVGVADSEVQYSAATGTSPSTQAVESLMNTVLQGGLTQPKMLTSMDVTCSKETQAAGSGFSIPGMLPTQALCLQWSLQSIPNLAGNLGRRIFVSDATPDLAAYQSGGTHRAALLSRIQQNAFELYRYGVLAPSMKANNVYSEAYELRTLVVDLRYDPIDLCILNALKQGATATAAGTQCSASAAGFPTEKTYQVTDVFDSGLAAASLSQFNPGRWTVTMQTLPFGLQPDGSVNAVQAATTKAALRQALNQPTVTNPVTGQPLTLTHPPFYRKMMVPDAQNNLQTISSSWENGIDPVSIMTLLTLDASQGGLGIYKSVWPEAAVVGAQPYHQSGEATVKPLALVLTPPPDGPLGEKWGVFPYNLTGLDGLGLLNEYGGGGWWLSTGGNEEGGGLLRRDFSWVVPQYFAGPSRGNGDAVPMGVMPDGSVQPFPLTFLTERALEIGAPHWCDEFDSPNLAERTACRGFVKSTTTLQAIETLQHGLGYLHTAEPRYRYHFDGTQSSFARLFQLLTNPSDTVGQLLQQDVNMYTTAGLSTVWSQSVSEWNGAGPHAGMQATLFRSHAREEMAAAEDALAQATAAFQQAFPANPGVLGLLLQAAQAHDAGLKQYDDWDYRGVLNSAMQSLSLTSRALALLGQGGKIHDPLQIPASAFESRALPSIDRATVDRALKSLTVEQFREGSLLLSAH
jgi:hypothetical protein